MTALLRLLSDSFRVFFLLASLWAAAAMALWLWWLWQNQIGPGGDLPNALAPSHWHAHELIFGFGMAATAGFFLTAAPNWTGKPVAGPRFIALMAGLWLAGRGGAVLLWGSVPPVLAAGWSLPSRRF
ncbi:NnrS family protein [Rhodobacter capsulatus]|uniref:NnrS family protein n=1 Tax=Rhodobacter capsulatus TaxID=1061 RepID=UPI0040266464